MVEAPERKRTRGELILFTAIEHIAKFGVRGSSLRDIARDAGTSLTLISHHFARKAALVEAAISALRNESRVPALTLERHLSQARNPSLEQIIEAWVRYTSEAFASASGMVYLRLLVRLQTDPDIAESARDTLDLAAPIVRTWLRQRFEEADGETFDWAWHLASRALHEAFLVRAKSADQRRWHATLEQFLVAGLNASLEPVERSADPRREASYEEAQSHQRFAPTADDVLLDQSS